MSRSLEVTRPFRERLQAFVSEAFPDQRRTVALGDRFQSDHSVGITEAARAQHAYIRQIRAGRTQQPPPDRAWEIGLAMASLSGRRWANPVVMLFACGHYGNIADLFVRALGGVIPRPELIELARTLPDVITTLSTASVAPAGLGFRGIGDALAVRQAKHWDSAFEPGERYDRRAWSIDVKTFGAFAEAWRAQSAAANASGNPRGLLLEISAVAACQLIADSAAYQVSDRDRFATLILTDWLSR